MRKILILALKDLKLAMRDRLAAFFYFVFPVLYAILIGYMMSGIAGLGVGMYRGTVSLAVVDQDRTEASARFLEYLKGAKELKVHQTDFEEAKDMVRLRRCTAYLILQKGFESTDWLMSPGRQPKMRLVTDETRLAEGQIVRGMVYMQLMDFVRSQFLAGLASNPEQSEKLRTIFRGYLELDTQLDPRLRKQLTGLLRSWESAEKRLTTSNDRPPSDPSMASESGRFKEPTLDAPTRFRRYWDDRLAPAARIEVPNTPGQGIRLHDEWPRRQPGPADGGDFVFRDSPGLLYFAGYWAAHHGFVFFRNDDVVSELGQDTGRRGRYCIVGAVDHGDVGRCHGPGSGHAAFRKKHQQLYARQMGDHGNGRADPARFLFWRDGPVLPETDDFRHGLLHFRRVCLSPNGKLTIS
ncbi:MAG: ABC transporter permease [Sedimentisphaerales bacterium]